MLKRCPTTLIFKTLSENSLALYPRQNSNSCLQHCCFELLLFFTFQYPTSTIQHCPFTIKCAYFKCNVVRTCVILIQCSMCLYGLKCDMLPTQSNILVQFLYSQSISLFCFQMSSFNMQHSWLSIQFWSSAWMLLCRVRYACYTIQYSCLDIGLHARETWTWVGRPLDKACGLKVIARSVPVVPHVPGDTVMEDSVPLGKHLPTTRRPHFVAWQSVPSIKIAIDHFWVGVQTSEVFRFVLRLIYSLEWKKWPVTDSFWCVI